MRGATVRTETAAIASKSDMKLYKDLGIDSIKFMASLDGKTCAVCGDMDGKVIPLKQCRIGLNMPPLHPNCRCYTVPVTGWEDETDIRKTKNPDGSYSEIPADTSFNDWKKQNIKPIASNPLMSKQTDKPDNKDAAVKETPEKLNDIRNGLASGEIGDKNGDSVIVNIEDFDYNDRKAIKERFNQFAVDYINSENEHALVITKSGKLYTLKGGSINVDVSLVGADELKGAIVIHNHPTDIFGNSGECFSKPDFAFMCEYAIAEMQLVNKTGRYSMSYTGGRISYNQANKFYEDAQLEAIKTAWKNNKKINDLQLETMKNLSRSLSTLRFMEL